jgi:serine/threonine protein kinase
LTKHYASPEVLIDKKAEIFSDVWSLGCVLYFMATQKAPWKKETRINVMKKVKKYLEARESLLHGTNSEYKKKCDWVATIIDGCT